MLHNLCDTVALHQVTVLIPGRAHRTARVCAGGLPVRAQPTSTGCPVNSFGALRPVQAKELSKYRK
jgi:hypothetical protein